MRPEAAWPIRAVLFDCDGVLVDSEPITHAVLREMLAELGWLLSEAECMQHFMGRTVRSQAALIEARTGQAFSEAWLQAFYVRRNVRLQAQLTPIAGAIEAVEAIHALVGGRIACASGADLPKVQMQLAQVGLARWFGAHVYSGHDLPRSKPFPDVYLHAARALDTPPEHCLVIEDTVTGVQAGVAAGACVVGYAPPRSLPGYPEAQALRAAGASELIADMRELPALVAARQG